MVEFLVWRNFHRFRTKGLLWVYLIVCLQEKSRADLVITPSSVELTGKTKTPVTLTCVGKPDDSLKEIHIIKSNKDENYTIAEYDRELGDEVQVSPKYLLKGVTAQLINASALSVRIPTITCLDSGTYTCLTVNDTGPKLVQANLTVRDGLQQAVLRIASRKGAISEGDVMKLTCRQIYGFIDPRDPRTEPKEMRLRWEFKKTQDKVPYTPILEVLSIFANDQRKTKCGGQALESVMNLYPLQHVHSNTTFRCYLIINRKPVDPELYATYEVGHIGPPAVEKPVPVVYVFSTNSLMALALGTGGFIGSIFLISIYFINKKTRLLKGVAVPDSLVQEEAKLDKLEEEFNKAVMGETTGAKTPPKNKAPVQKTPVAQPVTPDAESSAYEPSVAEKEESAIESSVAESSVAGEASSAVESSVVETSVAEPSMASEA